MNPSQFRSVNGDSIGVAVFDVLGIEGGGRRPLDEGAEWLVHHGMDVFVDDVDAVEEDLVEQLLERSWCVAVGLRAVLDEVEGEGEELFRGGEVLCEGPAFGLDRVEGGADAVLFLFHQVQRDRVGVVGLEQSFLFSFQLLSLGVQIVERLGGVLAAVGVFGGEVGFDPLPHLGCHVAAEGVVELGDFLFDVGDEHCPELAGGGLVVASAADEVRVGVSAA